MPKHQTRNLKRPPRPHRPKIKVQAIHRPSRRRQRRHSLSHHPTASTIHRQLRIPRHTLQIIMTRHPRSLFNHLKNRSNLAQIRPNRNIRRKAMRRLLIRTSSITRLFTRDILRFLNKINTSTRQTNSSARFDIPIQRRVNTTRLPRLSTILRSTRRPVNQPRPKHILPTRVAPNHRHLRHHRNNQQTRYSIATTVRRLRSLSNRLRVTRSTTTRLSLPNHLLLKGILLRPPTRNLSIISRILSDDHEPSRVQRHVSMTYTRFRIPNNKPSLRRNLRLPNLNPLHMMNRVKVSHTSRYTYFTFKTRHYVRLPSKPLKNHNIHSLRRLTNSLHASTRHNIAQSFNQTKFNSRRSIRIKSMIRFPNSTLTRHSSHRISLFNHLASFPSNRLMTTLRNNVNRDHRLSRHLLRNKFPTRVPNYSISRLASMNRPRVRRNLLPTRHNGSAFPNAISTITHRRQSHLKIPSRRITRTLERPRRTRRPNQIY